MKYADKLKDPRWQKKRLEIMQRDNFKCVFCGEGKITLHVHHMAYAKDTDPWDYPSGCLVTLCEDCHQGEHSDRAYVDSVLPATLRNYNVGSSAIIHFLESFCDTSDKLGIHGNTLLEDVSEYLNAKRHQKAA